MSELQPLAPRARLLFHLQALSAFALFWLPALVAGGVAAAFVIPPLVAAGLAGGALLVGFLVTLWLPSFAFDRWGWALREHDLLVQRGLLVRQVSTIPSGRIQHVDLRQGPVEQWMGLARVQVFTASGMGADAVIPGLELATAQHLRDQLVVLEGDDGV